MNRPTWGRFFATRSATHRHDVRRPRFLPVADALEGRTLLSRALEVSATKPGDYPTIGSAVAAASPGDTIVVCPGTYTEQVQIPAGKNNISLVSQRPWAAVIRAPGTLAADGGVVDVEGAQNVRICGFTITGPGAGTGSLNAGVYVGGGGSATITGNHITQIHGTPFGGNQTGVGVEIGLGAAGAGAGDTGTATVSFNLIDNYQKAGVVVDNAGSSATVSANAVVGSGPTAVIAQNGVEVSNGATATVQQNAITCNVYTGPNYSAAGIILSASGPVTVSQNLLTRNDVGVYVISSNGATVDHNVVLLGTYDGIDLEGSSGVTVTHNTTDFNGTGANYSSNPTAPDTGGDGIALFGGSTGNTIDHNESVGNSHDGIWVDATSTGNTLTHNTLARNAVYDAEDDSVGGGTAGTGNDWEHNQGKKDNHNGGLLH